MTAAYNFVSLGKKNCELLGKKERKERKHKEKKRKEKHY